MLAPLPASFNRLLELQRRRLATMRDQRAKSVLLEALKRARADVTERIRRFTQTAADAPYTLHQHQLYRVQIEQAMLTFGKSVKGGLGTLTAQALRQSIEDSLAQAAIVAGKYEGAPVPMSHEEATRLVMGDSKIREVEAMRITNGAAKYGLDMTGTLEGELAQSLLTGETTHQAAMRVMGTSPYLSKYYQAERLARTEFAHAYGAGARKILDAVAQTDPDLWVMWHEHAQGPEWAGPGNKPWTGPATPLDDRVGDDSLRLHGQLRRPGELFEDPETGQKFANTPSRPNGRETLILVRKA